MKTPTKIARATPRAPRFHITIHQSGLLQVVGFLTFIAVALSAISAGIQARAASHQTQLLATQVSASLSGATLQSFARARTYPDEVIAQAKADLTQRFLEARDRLRGQTGRDPSPEELSAILPMSETLPLIHTGVTIQAQNAGAQAATAMRIAVAWNGEIAEYVVESFSPPALIGGGPGQSGVTILISQIYAGETVTLKVTYPPVGPPDRIELVEASTLGDLVIAESAFGASFFPEFRLAIPPGKRTYDTILVELASDQTPYSTVKVLSEDALATAGASDVFEDFFPFSP